MKYALTAEGLKELYDKYDLDPYATYEYLLVCLCAIESLQNRVRELESRTVGSIMFGGGPLGKSVFDQ